MGRTVSAGADGSQSTEVTRKGLSSNLGPLVISLQSPFLDLYRRVLVCSVNPNTGTCGLEIDFLCFEKRQEPWAFLNLSQLLSGLLSGHATLGEFCAVLPLDMEASQCLIANSFAFPSVRDD